MKRIFLISAVFAMAFASCTKPVDDPDPTPGEEFAFDAGEKLVLTIALPETKAIALADAGGTSLKSTWEEGDKVTVSVGDEDAVFTLSSGAGESEAFFIGTMPVEGNTFDVKFPAEEPSLGEQTYIEGGFDSGLLSFSASECAPDADIVLVPANAVMKLSCYGSNVGKITVTNTTSSEDYTLNCGDAKTGVAVSSDFMNPTDFFLVVPAGEWKYKVSYYLAPDFTSPIVESGETSEAVVFEAGKIYSVDPEHVEEYYVFDAGEECLIIVELPVTKSVASYDSESSAFKSTWENGDEINVSVGDKDAVFTLTSAPGESASQFIGNMPARGINFDVRFPAEEPSLGEQSYVENGFDYDLMVLSASECSSIYDGIMLTPSNAVMKLSCYGTAVGKIVVENTTASETYTLDCGKLGVATGDGEENAVAFCLVVPAGEWKYKVSYYSVDDLETPVVESPETESAATFEAGKVFSVDMVNLPKPLVDELQYYGGGVTIDGITWAPVNCGYDPDNYKYGKLYQWGRKYGCGYAGQEEVIQQDSENYGRVLAADEDPSIFYRTNESTVYDWLRGWDETRWNLGTESVPVKNENYDPCPTGWRVPTSTEMQSLFAHYSGVKTVDGISGCYFSGSTSYAEGVTAIFLPFGGYKRCDGSCSYRADSGYYRVSSKCDYDHYSYHFVSAPSGVGRYQYTYCGYGMSVRCVKEN